MISMRLKRLYRPLSYSRGAKTCDLRCGPDTLGLQGIPEPVGVIAPITQQPLRLWQIVQKSGRASTVADLTCRHEKA